MKEEDRIAILALLILFVAGILIAPAAATTTEVTITKLADDDKTIINQTTVDWQWMRDNLPVLGDGETIYYNQGPVFEDAWKDVHPGEPYDGWNPTEDVNLVYKDHGEFMGTDVKDLCDLVGGASDGDMVTIKAFDGLTKTWPAEYIYNPNPRQGPMVIAWYHGTDTGYVNQSFSKGMRLYFLANTTNADGMHVWGNWDMHESWDEKYWYYYAGQYPSASGNSVQVVNKIIIHSTEEPPTGEINITSVPDGADIFLDSVATGNLTDAMLTTKVGKHTIQVEKTGYLVPEPQEVTVTEGAVSNVSFVLEPKGKIHVTSSPVGATILLDGDDTDKVTNATLENIMPGEHTVTLNLAGYEIISQTVTVASGETADWHCNLTIKGTSVLSRIVVTPFLAHPETGEQVRFSAIGYNQYGDLMPAIPYVWTSSNSTVGTINDTGVFSALTKGQATVGATSNNLTATATVLVTDPGEPKTWYVDDDGDADFVTIQDAVNNASRGDHIIVRDGNYSENVKLNKTVSLSSEDGPAETSIIAASNNDYAIEVTANGVSIKGFNVTGVTGYGKSAIYLSNVKGCNVSDNLVSGNKRGISLNAACNNTISRNFCTGSTDYSGGGLELRAGSKNNLITDNIATLNKGGGIYLYSADSNTVCGNMLSANGKGLYVYKSFSGTFTNNTIANSTSSGVSMKYSKENSIFFNNFINNKKAVDFSGNDKINDTNFWNAPTSVAYWYLGQDMTGYPGNYYDDYTGVDTDGDGLGDTRYQIYYYKYWNYGEWDYHPLMEPFENYSRPVPVLDSVIVSPQTLEITAGETQQFVATPIDQYGSPMTGVIVEWASSNETVGTINQTGFFTALTAGSTKIIASNGTVNGTVNLTVNLPPPVLSEIVINPSTLNITVGEKYQFSAIPTDQYGSPMAVSVNWSVSNRSIGAITSEGLFTALAKGTTYVTASAGAINATTPVIINNPHGDQTQDSSLNVPGCNLTPKGDGKEEVRVNTTAINATVSGNTIRIEEGTFSLKIRTEDVPNVVNGTVNGTVAGITLNTTPVTTTFDDLGTVTASLEANLTGIPSGAALQTTVSANVSVDAQSAFQLAASKGGLNLDAVAYTMNIKKTNLANGEDVSNATIRMAVSQAWVDAHGGADAVRIIRSAEDGTKEVLATEQVGTDADGNLVFEAYSPNGLSLFGLAATSTPSSGTTSSPSHSSSGGGSSEIAAISGSIPAGETQSFAVTETAVTKITVDAYDAIDGMLVTVQEASLPKNMTAPTQTTFQVIETTLYRADPSAINGVTLNFTVPTSWLDAHGLSADNIVLLGYENNGWKPLKTTFLKEGNEQVLYSAEAPGFSYFAIVAGTSASAGEQAGETVTPTTTATEPATTTAPATTPTTQQSPLPWFVAVVALGTLFLIGRKN